MKKTLLIAVCVAAAAALCGCGSNAAKGISRAVKTPLTATVACGDAVFVCAVTEDGFEAEFVSPAEASGLTLRSEADGVHASFGSHERVCGEYGFEAVRTFVKAVKALNGADEPSAQNGKVCEYAIDEMKIMVYYDSESNLITDLITEEAGRRFDYRFISADGNEGKSDGSGQPDHDTP